MTHARGWIAWGLWTLLVVGRVDGQEIRVGFWNVENLFDVVDDSLSVGDDEFTPSGSMHWTYRRYQRKLQDVYKTLAAMDFPAVMGLAEVENAHVLRDLTKGTPLARMGYQYLHFDSPDRRGIDCALIYRSSLFRLIDTNLIRFDFPTRDILVATGVTARGDTLTLWVCHLPSKLGGTVSEAQRNRCLARLRESMDSVVVRWPHSRVIAMGDFNAAPHELPDMGYRNLMSVLPTGEGSYCYQGVWEYIDQILTNDSSLAAQVFRHDYLLERDASRLVLKPRRTYLGPRYQGGVSDHLPIYTDLLW